VINIATFGERIRALGKKLGKEEQQIAKDLGLSKSQLSHYINGNRKVPSELLQQIVDTYNINPLFLFRENAPLRTDEEKTSYINKVNEYNYFPTAISAGLPFKVDGITKAEKISLPDNALGRWAGRKDIFVTKIFGESMNRVMPDGSLIVVKPTPLENLKDGDIVVYSVDHEYSIKRLLKQSGRLVFRPDSTDECFVDNIVSTDDENLRIYGKVVLYIVEMD